MNGVDADFLESSKEVLDVDGEHVRLHGASQEETLTSATSIGFLMSCDLRSPAIVLSETVCVSLEARSR